MYLQMYIQRKNVQNAKYIAIRTKIYCDQRGGGGVGLQIGLPKDQQKKLWPNFFFSGRLVDGRFVRINIYCQKRCSSIEIKF